MNSFNPAGLLPVPDHFDSQALTEALAAKTADLPLLERDAARDFAAGIPPETTAERHRCQPEEIRAALARARQTLGEAGLANPLTAHGDPALLIVTPNEPAQDSGDAGAVSGELLTGVRTGAELKAPPLDPAADERLRFVDFVLHDAEEGYRAILKELYLAWQEFNERFFGERLQPPHLTIASGPPRALGFFKSLTDYGGRIQITLDARVLAPPGALRRRFVKESWPAEGTRRFVKDLLKHEMVHQYLAEVEQFEDGENAKHGEAFADVCNRIGRAEGLPRVYTRRRGQQDAGKPLANLWPVNVRPAEFYRGHVIPPAQGRPARPPALRGLTGVLNLFRHLLDTGQADRLAGIVRREAARSHEPACAAKPAAEKGQVSHLNPAWLEWNGGCVRQLLHAICSRKMTDLMPLLADALEAAGCRDELVLFHCRLPARHTRDCWVLNELGWA
jgi:hypothetical protein